MASRWLIVGLVVNEVRGGVVAWYAIQHGALSGHINMLDWCMLAAVIILLFRKPRGAAVNLFRRAVGRMREIID
jgi:hypothetical protein